MHTPAPRSPALHLSSFHSSKFLLYVLTQPLFSSHATDPQINGGGCIPRVDKGTREFATRSRPMYQNCSEQSPMRALDSTDLSRSPSLPPHSRSPAMPLSSAALPLFLPPNASHPSRPEPIPDRLTERARHYCSAPIGSQSSINDAWTPREAPRSTADRRKKVCATG